MGTRGGAMVASGGDPEDEALDPELIHDLGLYELHDESRDGDPLGACRALAPPRAVTNTLLRRARCVAFLPRLGGAERRTRDSARGSSRGAAFGARGTPFVSGDARVRHSAPLSLRHRASP